MKKSLIIFTFLLTFSYVSAQENRSADKRSSRAVALILSEMELNNRNFEDVLADAQLKEKKLNLDTVKAMPQ